MGVKGLHRFMCQKGLEPAIREKFNLIEEIQKWKMFVFDTWFIESLWRCDIG